MKSSLINGSDDLCVEIIKAIGKPQLYWLVIALEVLYSKAWWLRLTNV
jgi:hypothetical protein